MREQRCDTAHPQRSQKREDHQKNTNFWRLAAPLPPAKLNATRIHGKMAWWLLSAYSFPTTEAPQDPPSSARMPCRTLPGQDTARVEQGREIAGSSESLGFCFLTKGP